MPHQAPPPHLELGPRPGDVSGGLRPQGSRHLPHPRGLHVRQPWARAASASPPARWARTSWACSRSSCDSSASWGRASMGHLPRVGPAPPHDSPSPSPTPSLWRWPPPSAWPAGWQLRPRCGRPPPGPVPPPGTPRALHCRAEGGRKQSRTPRPPRAPPTANPTPLTPCPQGRWRTVVHAGKAEDPEAC